METRKGHQVPGPSEGKARGQGSWQAAGRRAGIKKERRIKPQ